METEGFMEISSGGESLVTDDVIVACDDWLEVVGEIVPFLPAIGGGGTMGSGEESGGVM